MSKRLASEVEQDGVAATAQAVWQLLMGHNDQIDGRTAFSSGMSDTEKTIMHAKLAMSSARDAAEFRRRHNMVKLDINIKRRGVKTPRVIYVTANILQKLKSAVGAIGWLNDPELFQFLRAIHPHAAIEVMLPQVTKRYFQDGSYGPPETIDMVNMWFITYPRHLEAVGSGNIDVVI